MRFLQAPADSSAVELINLGIEAAAGAIVHVLSCDVEVIDGWTEPALVHFDDPALGSVSPLVVAEDGGKVVGAWRAVCRGWPAEAAFDGARRVGVLDASPLSVRRWRPVSIAARRSSTSVDSVAAVGEELADVDLACALARDRTAGGARGELGGARPASAAAVHGLSLATRSTGRTAVLAQCGGGRLVRAPAAARLDGGVRTGEQPASARDCPAAAAGVRWPSVSWRTIAGTTASCRLPGRPLSSRRTACCLSSRHAMPTVGNALRPRAAA